MTIEIHSIVCSTSTIHSVVASIVVYYSALSQSYFRLDKKLSSASRTDKADSFFAFSRHRNHGQPFVFVHIYISFYPFLSMKFHLLCQLMR